MSVAGRLRDVESRIEAAARRAGRDPADVHLIAVGKKQPLDALQAAAAAGQLDFGENYAQELRDKAAALDGPRWHFIGRIQTNKAKYVAPVAYRVHTLETPAQAEALVKRAPNGVTALVAVNIGREPQKSGVLPEDVLARCEALSAVDGLTLSGLMCLPPFREDPEDVGPFFAELADLAGRGRDAGFGLHELSMGMSHDFEVAIRHGATWVRVGTSIFGARPG